MRLPWPKSVDTWNEIFTHSHEESGFRFKDCEDGCKPARPPSDPSHLSVHSELILVEYLDKFNPHLRTPSSSNADADTANTKHETIPFDYPFSYDSDADAEIPHENIPFNYVAVSGLSCVPCEKWIKYHNFQKNNWYHQIQIRGANFQYSKDWLMPDFEKEALTPGVKGEALDAYIKFEASAGNSIKKRSSWEDRLDAILAENLRVSVTVNELELSKSPGFIALNLWHGDSLRTGLESNI